MKLAIYSLLRDRLRYTKHCFSTLISKAGYPYDHFIIDNGSEDGTVDWLKAQQHRFKHIIYNKENLGNSIGNNQALDMIRALNYDVVIRVDNDAEIISDNILSQIVEIYEDIGELDCRYMLSPRIEGIVNQPHREGGTQLAGRRIGFTYLVGGIFRIMTVKSYGDFRFPEDLPKAAGQEAAVAAWFKSKGGKVGYIEGLVVNHYLTTDGQGKDMPDYFKRKVLDEKEIPNKAAIHA